MKEPNRFLGPEEGKEIPLIGTLKVSGSQNGGSFELIDYKGPAVPPPHIHHGRDEAFYVLEGTFSFTLGDDAIEAGPGSLVSVLRGTPHGFKTTTGARALLFVAPAGLEGFFEELGRGLAAGRSGAGLREALSGKYDSEPVPSPTSR